MLASACIENFKGIKKCEIKDLSMVNLLIGKNDSGKSTLMEALYYTTAALTSNQDLAQLGLRQTNVFSSERSLWHLYNINSIISIALDYSEKQIRLRIAHDEKRSLTTSHFEYLDDAKKNYKEFMNISYSGLKVIIGGSISETLYKIPMVSTEARQSLQEYSFGASMIDCTLKHQASIVEKNLAKLKMSGNDHRFGSILQDIYDKGSEWEFVPNLDDPSEASRLALRENGRLTFFSSFGDGLRFCVGILGILMNLKNTVVFIEEIESHQHSGSLKKLLKYMVTIARENNLQVFLSTHSDEVWESLSRGVYRDHPEKKAVEFRCFVIERDVKTGEVSAQTTVDLQKINEALK